MKLKWTKKQYSIEPNKDETFDDFELRVMRYQKELTQEGWRVIAYSVYPSSAFIEVIK